jgi:CheY-like chemotaxis protein
MFGDYRMTKTIVWVDNNHGDTVYHRNAISDSQDVEFRIYQHAGTALKDLVSKKVDLIVMNPYLGRGTTEDYPVVAGETKDPNLVGLDLVARIRKTKTNKQTPIVAITNPSSGTETSLETDLLGAGASRVVDLLVSPSVLYKNVLQRYLN